MPRLLSGRLGEDTILKLEAAAEARRKTAFHLHQTGFWLAAVYFYGYSAEQRVKAAYFRAAGFATDQIIRGKDREDAVREHVVLGLPRKPSQHDIHGWAQLLVAKRQSLHRPYEYDLGNEIVLHAEVIERRWKEILRYRVNVPYPHELRKVGDAALWFEQNYREIC